jgi:hypothetical protein
MYFEPQNPDNPRHISTLKRTEPINLILYANGIFLFNGPFRPFSGRIISFFYNLFLYLIFIPRSSYTAIYS